MKDYYLQKMLHFPVRLGTYTITRMRGKILVIYCII